MFKDEIRCPMYHHLQPVKLIHDNKINRWFVECPNECGCDTCRDCLFTVTPKMLEKHLSNSSLAE